MLIIIGVLIVFGSVAGGYLMEKGNMLVLMQPAELLIIGGAAIGTVLIGNPLHVLKAIIEKIGGDHFPAPHRFDDAAWVGYRLSEVLPISLETKQQLLQLADPQIRLVRLRELLAEQGVGSN